YENAAQRAECLTTWLHQYNWHRPHSSLGYLPPVSRLPLLNNLVALHS
ncbi:integrase core domain-containing protein, partial [Alcanivorax sp. MM125-6]|nr:integrase core domain-containing protein [Alcanivorax sp. MM125-6]MCQ6263948.1 integrase core domain-containing protein [Alcanivorax sp. MM125-6]